MRRRSRPRCYLKHVLHGELHDPGLDVGLNLAEGAAVQGRIGAAAGDTNRTWIQEISAILNIERFRADFEVLLFPDMELARQGNVHVEVTGTFQVIDSQVTEGARGRRGKRLRVHPAIDGL